jgi:uncharacterized small protein (DUF1192 family)
MPSNPDVERLLRIRHKVGQAFANAIQDATKLAGGGDVPGNITLLSIAGLQERVPKIFSNEVERLEDEPCQLPQKSDNESMS